MASKQTEDARGRATSLARTLRLIGAHFANGGTLDELKIDVRDGAALDALEIAAILLEQTSVARYNKAKAAFNAAHGRFVRRQKVGQ